MLLAILWLFAGIGAFLVTREVLYALRDVRDHRAMRHSHSRAWTRLSRLDHILRSNIRLVLQVNAGGTVTIYVPDDFPAMPDGYCYAKDAPSLDAALDQI